MNRYILGIILCFTFSMNSWSENPKQSLPEFNQLVLKLIKDYPTDGTHKYYWPRQGGYDGCT